jgi:hypothetical protein
MANGIRMYNNLNLEDGDLELLAMSNLRSVYDDFDRPCWPSPRVTEATRGPKPAILRLPTEVMEMILAGTIETTVDSVTNPTNGPENAHDRHPQHEKVAEYAGEISKFMKSLPTVCKDFNDTIKGSLRIQRLLAAKAPAEHAEKPTFNPMLFNSIHRQWEQILPQIAFATAWLTLHILSSHPGKDILDYEGHFRQDYMKIWRILDRPARWLRLPIVLGPNEGVILRITRIERDLWRPYTVEMNRDTVAKYNLFADKDEPLTMGKIIYEMKEISKSEWAGVSRGGIDSDSVNLYHEKDTDRLLQDKVDALQPECFTAVAKEQIDVEPTNPLMQMRYVFSFKIIPLGGRSESLNENIEDDEDP